MVDLKIVEKLMKADWPKSLSISSTIGNFTLKNLGNFDPFGDSTEYKFESPEFNSTLADKTTVYVSENGSMTITMDKIKYKGLRTLHGSRYRKFNPLNMDNLESDITYAVNTLASEILGMMPEWARLNQGRMNWDADSSDDDDDE